MVFYQAFCGVLPRPTCFLVHHSLSAIVGTYRLHSDVRWWQASLPRQGAHYELITHWGSRKYIPREGI